MTFALDSSDRVAFPLQVLPDSTPESIAHRVRYVLTTQRGTHAPDRALGLDFAGWDTYGTPAAARAQAVRLQVAQVRGVVEVLAAQATQDGEQLTIAVQYRVADVDDLQTVTNRAADLYAVQGAPPWYIVGGALRRGVIVGA